MSSFLFDKEKDYKRVSCVGSREDCGLHVKRNKTKGVQLRGRLSLTHKIGSQFKTVFDINHVWGVQCLSQGVLGGVESTVNVQSLTVDTKTRWSIFSPQK